MLTRSISCTTCSWSGCNTRCLARRCPLSPRACWSLLARSFLAGEWPQVRDGLHCSRRDPSRSCKPTTDGKLAADDKSQLANRIEIPCRGAGVVLADAQRFVVDETIGRHRQVVRRRHARIYPARRVVFRAVARTKITAGAIGHWRRRACIRIKQWDATEMRADADQHAEFRLERAVPIGGIGRLLQRFGIRIGKQSGHLL